MSFNLSSAFEPLSVYVAVFLGALYDAAWSRALLLLFLFFCCVCVCVCVCVRIGALLLYFVRLCSAIWRQIVRLDCAHVFSFFFFSPLLSLFLDAVALQLFRLLLAFLVRVRKAHRRSLFPFFFFVTLSVLSDSCAHQQLVLSSLDNRNHRQTGFLSLDEEPISQRRWRRTWLRCTHQV